MIALGATLAVLLAADLPRDPCAEPEAAHAALREAADADTLDGHLGQLGGLLSYPIGQHLPDALSPDERLDRALRRFDAFCALARRPRPSPSRTEPERLAAILERPEFEGARQRHTDVLASLIAKVRGLIASLFETRGAETFATSTRFLILALAVALVLFLALRLRAWRGGRRAVTSAGIVAAPLLLEDPSTHLERARDAIGEEPRRAIREALLALLSALERRRWARPDRVKTNRELARELPARGAPADIAAHVEEMVRWYDRTFYSLEPVSTDEARRFVDEIARFEDGLRAQGGGA